MKGRKWLWAFAAAVAVGSAPGLAAAQDLAKCQKQIENIGRSFQDKVFKALQWCKDTYRTEVVKAQVSSLTPAQLALNLDKKAPACGKKLTSVVGETGGGLGTLTPKTQAEKHYKKLADLLVRGKCTADHIIQLGHLSPNSYGDAWIRWILVSQLKSAYEKQAWLVADLPSILNAFINPDSSNPGDCSVLPPAGDGKNYCAVLAQSPCHKLNCRISAGTQLQINLCGLGSVTPALGGEVIQEYCQFPPWTGCDIAIVGNPARSIDPVTFFGNTACTTNFRAEGWVKGQNSCTIGYGGPNGSPVTQFTESSVINGPKDITVCQDANKTNGDSCTAGTFSLPAGSDPCPCTGQPPNDVQVTLSGSLAAGDSISSAALLIHTVKGPHACSGTTSDATFVPLMFSTGNVNVDLYEAEASGTPCTPCASPLSLAHSGAPHTLLSPDTNANPASSSNFMDSSDLNGGQVAGGFPGACPTGVPPLVTAFKLVCGP